MPNSKDQRKITIEDLLRLKRAERPGPEFWSNFEHELHQKQLTALMQRRPWWQGMPQLFVRRAYLPLGATAVLAFTLVTVKYYTPQQIAQMDYSHAGSSAPLSNPQEVQPGQAAAVAVSSPLLNHHEPATQRLDDRATVVVTSQLAAAVVPNQASETITLGSVETPSARTIAANLAHLEQAEPELMNAVLGSRLSPPPRSAAAVAPMTEMATLSSNASRRSRLLAVYNDHPVNPEPTAPDIVRERLSRRLGDADYAERFSRIGLKGDQVSLGVSIKL